MIRRTTLLVVLLLIVAPVAVSGCGGGGGPPPSKTLPGEQFHDLPIDPNPPAPPAPPPPTPPPPATPPGSTTSQPWIPRSTTPPIGLTWRVGFTENATATELESVYATVVAMNSALWNVTEGQVYIYLVVITDNVGPGTTPTSWEANKSSIDTSSLDALVWPTNKWDQGGTLAFTLWSASVGYSGAIMAYPANASSHTWLHECGHFAWDLSWAGSYGLDDEYIDGVQDAACVMESERTPLRWCSSANHTGQSSQPHSCWHQILTDYPNFAHSDQDSSSSSPWTPKVTYSDAP